jgi:hypothetical protein
MSIEWAAFMAFVWLVSGFLSSGVFYAHFQRKFPSIADDNRREDAAAGVFFGLVFGPIGLFLSLFLSGFLKHGWALPGTDSRRR